MEERAPQTPDEADQEYVAAAIEAGMADSRAGRTMTHAELVARMEARFTERRK